MVKNFFTKEKIIFLTKYPTLNDLKDGYFQRVKKVDGLFDTFFRIYLNRCNEQDKLILIISKNCIQLNLKGKLCTLVVLLLLIFVKRVYAHSVFSLACLPFRVAFKLSQKSIWDVHGIVPEEFAYNNDLINFQQFSRFEKFAYKNASHIIFVTQKMENYLMNKYNYLSYESTKLILPIIPNCLNLNFLSKVIKEKPIVIYSGGLQKWQQVEKMMLYVNKNAQKYNFIFLVPDVDYLLNVYCNISKGGLFPGIVKSVNFTEVPIYYKKAHFGLILRQDIIVNKVACPTKMLEYMMYNIVPIVESADIGDFETFGYSYVSYQDEVIDLRTLDLPGAWQINHQVLKKMEQIFNETTVKLVTL